MTLHELSLSDPCRLPLARKRNPNSGHREGGIVKRPGSIIATVVGAASFLLAGYVLLTSLPDLRRYIKISMM
jgi:uncharacterized protein DUF6893